MVDRFRPLHGFLSARITLGEISALGETAGQEATGPHGGEYGEADPLTDPIAL